MPSHGRLSTDMASEKLHYKCICVIGAGPAGLASARELLIEGHTVVVLEQNHDVGGQWLYAPDVDQGAPTAMAGVHSSVYASLRMFSPRDLTGFTDFPFLPTGGEGRDARRFPGHAEVLRYLKDFSEWAGLQGLTRLNSRVEYVGMATGDSSASTNPSDSSGNGGWIVRSRETKTGKVTEEVFDAVVVASGHCFQPRLPAIGGMDSWTRKQLHSHVYRVPEPFLNEVVVVIGDSVSGPELTLELVHVAKEVHHSSRSLLNPNQGLLKLASKHQNLHLWPQIELLCEDGRVVFVDGSCVVADTIIYCTGYSYSFPFLDTRGVMTVDDNRVGSLYEHTFPPSLSPSLSFVGIPSKVFGFRFYESQGRWIAQVLSGKRKLPPVDSMMNVIQQFYHSLNLKGIPKHRTHMIEDLEYIDVFRAYCELLPIEEWEKESFSEIYINYVSDFATFRDEFEDEELIRAAL